jgi:hypothetical protein
MWREAVIHSFAGLDCSQARARLRVDPPGA